MEINYSLSNVKKLAKIMRFFMIGLPYPEISPIALSIGPLAIRWYSLAYLVGILAAWFLILRNNKKYELGYTSQNIEDLTFFITMGIILGGRLGYAVFYGGEEMWLKPWKILEIWKGGMSFHGGICGVIIAALLYAKKYKLKFLAVTDLVALYSPIGIFLGRLANFTNDELWGRVTNVPWAIRFPNGGYLPRHPSQLYEAFLEGIILFGVLNYLWSFKKVRNNPGTVSALFVLLYGLFRICMEQFRQPDAHMGFYFNNITMGQLLSVPFVIVGICIILKNYKKS